MGPVQTKRVKGMNRIIVILLLACLIALSGCSDLTHSATTTTTTITPVYNTPIQPHPTYFAEDLGAITAGLDGNLWFTEPYGNRIGKISPVTGTVTDYATPTDYVYPYGIIGGPDGNLWFTEQSGNRIGKISSSTGDTI